MRLIGLALLPLSVLAALNAAEQRKTSSCDRKGLPALGTDFDFHEPSHR